MTLWQALLLAWIFATIGVIIGGWCKRSELASVREEARMEYAVENSQLLGWVGELEKELNAMKQKEATT